MSPCNKPSAGDGQLWEMRGVGCSDVRRTPGERVQVLHNNTGYICSGRFVYVSYTSSISNGTCQVLESHRYFVSIHAMYRTYHALYVLTDSPEPPDVA